MSRLAPVLVLLASFPMSATAIDPVAIDDPEQDARYRALIEEIRCLVCQNQTLADSNAPLAVDLREQVRIRIEQGASDAEIVAYLTDRYGDFVLYRPPFNTVTALLWLSPVLLLMVGGFVSWRVLRPQAHTVMVLDDGRRRRVREMLEPRERP